MTDVLTPEQRRKNMSAIKGKDSRPEMIVRSLAHRLGYRYRLHYKKLPGKPDLAFPGRRKAIFVHGCYWHLHDCRYGQVVPKTNMEFWQRKRQETAERDARNLQQLESGEWQALVIWECETKNRENLERVIREFLDD